MKHKIKKILTLLNLFFKGKIRFNQIKQMYKNDNVKSNYPSKMHIPSDYFNN